MRGLVPSAPNSEHKKQWLMLEFIVICYHPQINRRLEGRESGRDSHALLFWKPKENHTLVLKNTSNDQNIESFGLYRVTLYQYMLRLTRVLIGSYVNGSNTAWGVLFKESHLEDKTLYNVGPQRGKQWKNLWRDIGSSGNEREIRTSAPTSQLSRSQLHKFAQVCKRNWAPVPHL